MTTRQQRRNNARKAAKKPQHGKSEVFNYTDENGDEQWIAVEPLRQWAEKNLTISAVDIDPAMVERTLKSDRVTQEHVMQHTMKQDVRPILIAEDYHDGMAEIVDGNHTYVAMAVAAKKGREMGLEIPPHAPAYCIKRSIWMQFLVPLDQRS